MKKQIVLVMSMLLALVLTACGPRALAGSGHIKTENRSISGLSGISLQGMGDVTITQGDTEALSIEAEDNLLPLIKTEMRNGTLVIYFDRDPWGGAVRPTRPFKFTVSVKNLRSLEISGAGNVQADRLNTDRLTLTVSGAGNVMLPHLYADELIATLNGASNVNVGGTVTLQVATLNGLGNYNTADLSSRTARLTVSGAGNATVWAADSLYVNINGAGSINYYGNPRITKSVAGLGSIRNVGTKAMAE